jgi:outer membrane protein assembly factor BamD
MEESAEAQYKICMIHYKAMDKPDRDDSQALRAEDECRNLLVQYPNSKHAPQAAQLLRNIQEVLGEHQFRIGTFYFEKGANPAAANRLSYAVDQYPLYSNSDEALWEAGKAYLGMGPKFRQTAADAFSRIVRDYPLSVRVEDAKQQLQDMEMPIPQGDRTAYDRQKYDLENYKGRSLISRSAGFLLHGPDVSNAAKSGQPSMQDVAFPIPASVPKAANDTETAENGAGGGTTDIQGGVVQDPSKLNQSPDARQAGGVAGAANPPARNEAMPSNHEADLKKARKQAEKKAKKSKKKNAAKPASTPAAAEAPNATPADSQQPAGVQAQPATQ